jgi:hypothetical protein
VNEKLNCLLTGSEEGTLYIRNLYDLELMTCIKIKLGQFDKPYSVVDIKISNINYLYVTCYNTEERFILCGYTVNGILFSYTKKLYNNIEFTNSGRLVVGQYLVNKFLVLDPIDLDKVNKYKLIFIRYYMKRI